MIIIALEALFYGVMVALAVFVVLLVRKYNLQSEIATLVSAAEMIFPGSKKGTEKKEWVINALTKKFTFLNQETINNIIECFVYEITQ